MNKIIARAIVTACVLVTTAANAAWPDRTVTLIVPYAAGGISDVLARLTAEQLQASIQADLHRAERGRRRRHHRHGQCGARQARRLHAVVWPDRAAHAVAADRQGQLRPRQGFRAGVDRCIDAVRRHRQRRLSCEHARGIHRRGEKEAGHLHLCFGRRRQHDPCRLDVVSQERGLADDPRAVSRRRTGVHRHVCRQRPNAVGKPGRADAACRFRQR